MLSASAFSSRSCCVMSEPGGGGGAGVGDRVLDRLGVLGVGNAAGRRTRPSLFSFFSESPKHAARGARATCSPALRPHEIFMQGIGAARDERIRVASATRDEALGVLTRKPPPYTRRTSSSAFSRTARLIDTLVFGVFETLQCATALPHPPFRPRATCPRCHVSFASAWTRVRARRPPSRRPARVYPPPAFLTGNRPKRTPDADAVGIPALVATARVRRAARAGDLRAAAGGAGPAADRGRPGLRPYEPRPTRDPLPSGFRPGEDGGTGGTSRTRRKFRSPWWRPSPRSRSRTSRPPTRPGGSRRRRRATRESETGFGKRRKRGERRRRGVAPAGLSRRRRRVPRNERERPTLKRFGDAAA